MARRRNIGAAAGSQSGLKFPKPSGPWGALQAVMDDGGQLTLGAVSGIRAAAIATMPRGMLAGLMRRENAAVMQCVVDGRVMNEVQL